MSNKDSQFGQASVWNVANALTVLRLFLVPFFIWALLEYTDNRRWIAFIIFAIASLTDKIDGTLARKYNLITDFGKLADGIADKALILSGLILFSWHGTIFWWVTIIFIVRELAITLMRMVVVKKQVIAAGMTGKLKMVAQVAFMGILMIPWESFVASEVAAGIYTFGYVLVGVALILAYWSAVEYVYLAFRKKS